MPQIQQLQGYATPLEQLTPYINQAIGQISEGWKKRNSLNRIQALLNPQGTQNNTPEATQNDQSMQNGQPTSSAGQMNPINVGLLNAELSDVLGQQGANAVTSAYLQQQKMGQRERLELRKEGNESWKEHAPYINEQEDKYRSGQTTIDKLQIQKDLVASGKLASPPLAYLAETMGIEPLMYNEPTQLYQKVQADLAGGFTKWVGTAKSNMQEFNIFLKKFPTLKNTDAGKNLILDYQLVEQKMANAEAKVTQDLVDKYQRSGQPLPHNFRSVVNKMVDAEYEKGGLELRNIMKRANGLVPSKKTASENIEKKEELAPGKVYVNPKSGQKIEWTGSEWRTVE